MDENDYLVEAFEQHRTHLRAVAYRMLGSLSEADDALQESWLRVSRAGADDVENMGGWLTTIVGRVCLNMLRSRTARREEPLGPYLPEPIVSPSDGVNPEHEALLADSVGLALLVVLEMLSPAERLAFVLHDMFGVPFEEIAPMVGRSPDAARQLASRARRRVRGTATFPDGDLASQRAVVDAFFAASRDGDFDALVAVLDPDVVLRSDGGAARPGSTGILRGAEAVATGAGSFRHLAGSVRPVLINGSPGVVAFVGRRPFSLLGFTVSGGKIVEIDIFADPERLAELDLTALDG
jgi:RNA polymerase sigma factor (sigma-70 family)